VASSDGSYCILKTYFRNKNWSKNPTCKITLDLSFAACYNIFKLGLTQSLSLNAETNGNVAAQQSGEVLLSLFCWAAFWFKCNGMDGSRAGRNYQLS